MPYSPNINKIRAAHGYLVKARNILEELIEKARGDEESDPAQEFASDMEDLASNIESAEDDLFSNFLEQAKP